MAGGRPSTLTPALRERLVEAVRDKRLSYRRAAGLCRVYERQLTAWLQQGRADLDAGQDDTEHAQLLFALEEAVAERQARSLDKASGDDGGAGERWYLERAYPREFGSLQKVAGPDGDALKIDTHATHSVDALTARILAHAARRAGLTQPERTDEPAEHPEPDGSGAGGTGTRP